MSDYRDSIRFALWASAAVLVVAGFALGLAAAWIVSRFI